MTDENTARCAYDGKEFVRRRPNQKYCSAECTKRANNQRAMARYNRRKALKQSGAVRVCATPDCNTILRKSNEGDYCGACELRQRLEQIEAIRRSVFDA